MANVIDEGHCDTENGANGAIDENADMGENADMVNCCMPGNGKLSGASDKGSVCECCVCAVCVRTGAASGVMSISHTASASAVVCVFFAVCCLSVLAVFCLAFVFALPFV